MANESWIVKAYNLNIGNFLRHATVGLVAVISLLLANQQIKYMIHYFSRKGGELHRLSFKDTQVHVQVHWWELARRGELKHELGCTWVETARGALCSGDCKADENLSSTPMPSLKASGTWDVRAPRSRASRPAWRTSLRRSARTTSATSLASSRPTRPSPSPPPSLPPFQVEDAVKSQPEFLSARGSKEIFNIGPNIYSIME